MQQLEDGTGGIYFRFDDSEIMDTSADDSFAHNIPAMNTKKTTEEDVMQIYENAVTSGLYNYSKKKF